MSQPNQPDPIGAWMESLGYEKSKVRGYRKWFDTPEGSKFYFLTDEQAAFFYSLMLRERLRQAEQDYDIAADCFEEGPDFRLFVRKLAAQRSALLAQLVEAGGKA